MNLIRTIFDPDGSSEITTRRDSIGSSILPASSNSKRRTASAGGMTSMIMAAPPPLMFDSSPRTVASDPPSNQVNFARSLTDRKSLPETAVLMVLEDHVEGDPVGKL